MMSQPLDRQRIMALLRVLGHSGGKRWWGVIGLWVIGCIVLTLGLTWDGESLRLVGMENRSYRVYGEIGGKVALLGELFSWTWLIVVWGYVLPGVFLPLAQSFGTRHTLWLRLTPCRPIELRLARCARLLIVCIGLLALAGSWCALMVFVHGLPFADVAVWTLGLLANLLLSGGLILLIGPWLRSERSRTMLAITATLVPMLLGALYLAARHEVPAEWADDWPYAGPFLHRLAPPAAHYGAALLGGLVLLFASLLSGHGRDSSS